MVPPRQRGSSRKWYSTHVSSTLQQASAEARTMIITIGVTARNEEATIGDCLRSLLASVRYAEARLPLQFRMVVVLDDCTDRTADVVRSFQGVETLSSTGGKI